MNDQGRRSVDAAKSAVVASWLKLRDREDATGEPPPDPGAGSPPEEEAAAEESLLDRYMPTPQAAAVAVMALLAAGVVLGAVTDPFAQSAGAPTILVSAPAAAPEEEESQPEVVEEVVEEEAPASEAAAEAPAAPPEEILEEPLEETTPPPKKPPFELPSEAALPPITHVYMIVLGDQGYGAAFGKASTAPYLSKTLAKKGEVLENYYAVTQGDLANQIALLSGQSPTPQTAAGCPEYTDIAPGTVNPATVGTTELVEGEGCVYPQSTPTLPGQLKTAGQTWRAYFEEGGQPAAACGPGPDPLAYFHSLLDSGECAESAVGLEQLAPDLKKVSTEAPALSYIVPDACHDGSEVPCAPGAPAGLAGAESFLQTVVPEIEASDAYKVGGLIAITFAQAPQSGPAADPSACCATPEYPSLKTDPNAAPALPDAHGVKPSGGGGRVGMLLISPYVLPGSVDKTGYFNHFSFLRSIEELFGLSALGYAAEPAVVPFDEVVYNNTES
jgi:phosphatidylinositol-3-phosphatase